MIRRVTQLLILIVTLSLTSGAWATTYYIDWVSGADTNDGLTKSTPWKRAPGMVGCSDNCLAKKTAVVQPGDQIILKGGVTWPNAALGWYWRGSGNATTSSPGCSGSGCIYIGVDETWFTGASWSRPILDAGGAVVTGDAVNVLLYLRGNYLIVDNIEIKGMYWPAGTLSYGSHTNVVISPGSPGWGTNITLKNLYIHGWSHDTYANGAKQRSCGVVGDTATPNNNVNTILQDSVIDGSDTARDSCSGVFGSPPYIVNNLFRHMANGMVVNGTVKISGNTITNIGNCFDPTAHTNAIEVNASNDIEISNNVIANLGSGTVGIWTATNAGYTATIFNNVIYDTDISQYFNVAAPVVNGGCAPKGTTGYCLYAGTTNIYNNTIECGPDSNPTGIGIANINVSSAEVKIINNHFITSAITPNDGAWSVASGSTTTITANNNIVQSKSIANAQGYTLSNKYPFRGAGVTVGAGMDLQSLSGIPSAALSSTSCGVKYDELNHRVIGNYITPQLRGTNWDIGAYYGRYPAPPTSLSIQ